jgi:hypothetical protein
VQTIYQENSNLEGGRLGLDRRVSADPNYKVFEKRITGDRRLGTRRRMHKRFRVKDLTFVKLNPENKENIGELLDISKGGLSLRYFVKEEAPRDYSDLGLFSSGGDLIIDEVLFSTVLDTELVNKMSYSTIRFRRYGVQFEELTSEQTAQLDYFLSYHTLGET